MPSGHARSSTPAVLWPRRYISQQQYDGLIARLQQEFVNPPVQSAAVGCCAMMLCACTMGVCFCPCYYLKKKVTAFNAKLDATVKDAVRELGINKCEVKVHMNQKQSQQSGWIDSKGQTLIGQFSTGGEHSHTYSAPAGPPNGYNLVLIGASLAAGQPGNAGNTRLGGARAALPWPPSSGVLGSTVVAVQAVPAVAMPGMVEAPDMNRQHVDTADEIRKLSDLHQQGILTDAEFADAKAKVISQQVDARSMALDDQAQLQSRFAKADLDSDGSLSRQEVEQLLRSEGLEVGDFFGVCLFPCFLATQP
jgi:hypothetical protein